MDLFVFYLINHLPHPAAADFLARWLHYATRTGIIYYPFLIWLWLSRDTLKQKLATLGLVSGLASFALTDLTIKYIFSRPRPYQALADAIYVPPAPHSFSFPSGQTGTAFAIATLIFLLYPTSKFKYLVLAFALLVAFDRVYMGHHYPSDVAAGAFIGIFTSLVLYYIVLKRKLFVKL